MCVVRQAASVKMAVFVQTLALSIQAKAAPYTHTHTHTHTFFMAEFFFTGDLTSANAWCSRMFTSQAN